MSDGALLLVDTAPIIYWIENREPLATRFAPLFERHREGRVRFAVTTITIAETLVLPLRQGDAGLATRYRRLLEAWRVVELTAQVAEDAASLRARFNLKLPDAVQAASAFAVNAEALVTYDRDFSRVSALTVLR